MWIKYWMPFNGQATLSMYSGDQRLLHILYQHCMHFLYITKIIEHIDQYIWYNSIEIFHKKHHPSVKILSHFISNFTFWIWTQKPKACIIQTSNKCPISWVARIQKFRNPVNSLGSIYYSLRFLNICNNLYLNCSIGSKRILTVTLNF